jgi:hypothetical protein
MESQDCSLLGTYKGGSRHVSAILLLLCLQLAELLSLSLWHILNIRTSF